MRAVRRRFRVRVQSVATSWPAILEDATQLHDPQAMELAACIGLMLELLLERAAELDDDCVGAPA